MCLDDKNSTLFFKLYYGLMHLLVECFELSDGELSPDDLRHMALADRVMVRDLFLENLDIIDRFVRENRWGFSSEELEIVKSWKECVYGRFYVFEYQSDYTVFLSVEEPSIPYAVKTLNENLPRFYPKLPVMVEAFLLPFGEVIVCDSLIQEFKGSMMSFSHRSALHLGYRKSLAKYGLIRTLPVNSTL